MTKKLKILITNDDGVHAAGIRHLWSALQDKADVTVVAPAREQSAVGLGITIRHPLQLEKISGWPSDTVWSLNGTPADCVKLALNIVLEDLPDLIVSGINKGANSGRNVLYSGTVAAAIEGALQGIPSVAFSCYEYDHPDYVSTLPYIYPVIEHVVNHPLPEGTLLNINFPNPQPDGKILGIKLTRQGKELWSEDPNQRLHPVEGNSYYWLGARLKSYEEHEDSDVAWIKRGFAAAVPVHVGELTDHKHLSSHKERFDSIFA